MNESSSIAAKSSRDGAAAVAKAMHSPVWRHRLDQGVHQTLVAGGPTYLQRAPPFPPGLRGEKKDGGRRKTERLARSIVGFRSEACERAVPPHAKASWPRLRPA